MQNEIINGVPSVIWRKAERGVLFVIALCCLCVETGRLKQGVDDDSA
jgi:hypothetical protein